MQDIRLDSIAIAKGVPHVCDASPKTDYLKVNSFAGPNFLPANCAQIKWQ